MPQHENSDSDTPVATRRCSDEWRLTTLAVFPTKGEPGSTLPQGTLTDSGLLGDRHKKHALLVASVEDVEATAARGEELRANIVLTAPSAVLQEAGGRELRIGDAVVRIDRKPSACDGMYAEVVEPGDILVGDRCRLE